MRVYRIPTPPPAPKEVAAWLDLLSGYAECHLDGERLRVQWQGFAVTVSANPEALQAAAAKFRKKPLTSGGGMERNRPFCPRKAYQDLRTLGPYRWDL